MRSCTNCSTELPPETEHYEIDNDPYCTECVKAEPYTSYSYYLDGEYKGNSEGDGDCRHVESYDDDYDLGEEETNG